MATFTYRTEESFLPIPKSVLRVAVKDLIDMAGVITTRGSRVIATSDAPAESDAVCMRGTRQAVAAGAAVIVGKTNLHELAYGVTGINPWYGTPVNPLDPSLAPGGSSSGSAVAVASGEADVAFGSDTGGSIRIPAACCGVVGLKTTWGRISLKGVAPLAPSLDTVGPMGSTLEAVEAGMALLEPGFNSANCPPPLRIGRVRLPAERRTESAIDAAIQRYCSMTGAGYVDLTLAGWEKATWAAATILDSEAWGVYAQLWHEHSGELSPDVAERLEAASHIPPGDISSAQQIRSEWAEELRQTFALFDVLALPVLSSRPPRLADAAELKRIRYVSPFNLAGIPALAMPVSSTPLDTPTVHATASRVPVSLQLAGPHGGEEVLLSAGRSVAKVAGWTASRP
ncbi:MAG: amidase [Acidimicrobiales bacterium]